MAKEPALIGLDIGTSGIKAVAFDLTGGELAKAIEPTPTRHLPDGRAEHDPEELWTTCISVLTSVGSLLADREIVPIAMACSSMAEAGVLLGAGGEPVYPIIPWFDSRTETLVRWWRSEIGVEATAGVCGVVPHPMFGMPKLMWIRDHEPKAFAAGRVWLNMADYAEYRMCGSVTTDYSLASRTLVLDLVERRWSTELLDAIGIAPNLLAELVPAGTRVGALHGGVAATCGLPAALPIVRGGQDHVCAATAFGITEAGVVLDSIGTAEAFFAARTTPDMTGRLWPDELNQGVHVVPGLTYVMTGTGEGAGRIDAHRAKLGVDFATYLAAAATKGPEREMVESLAVEGQQLFERMAWASETSDIRHVATGGGTRIPLLMQRKREIGGREIEVPDIAEATCLGAALLAGAGVGVYSSIEGAPAEALTSL